MQKPWPVSERRKGVVYVLDVSFFTFRAYHALPPLNTEDGLPTNAVHGVATMLEKLIRTEKPQYVAACFDSPGQTFRNDLYPQYKANRDEPDEDLRRQFPYVRRLIEAMSIRCLDDPRYEADDLLGSLAAKMTAAGYDVVLVTGDKDLMQCVNDHVSLYDPVKDVRVGAAQVVEKFGVPPDAVTDVQGLMGDSTDNIPGVRGVGPKTATALIQHFHSLEALLADTAQVEQIAIRGAAGVRRKVEESADMARLSKSLATVKSDIPLELTADDLRFVSLHTPELVSLAEELEMRNFASRVRKLLPGGEADAPAAISRAAGSPSAGEARSSVAAPSVPKPALSGRWEDIQEGEVLFLLRPGGTADGDSELALGQREVRCHVVGEHEVRKVVQGLAERGVSFSGFDLKGLCRTYEIEPGPASVDVGVASYLHDPSIGEHGDDAVTQRFLDESRVPLDAGLFDANDALDQLDRLVTALRAALVERDQVQLYETIELPLIGILAHIEATGILLDLDLLRELSRDFAARMKALVADIYRVAGREFNILSPVQLREVLFDELKLTTKGVKKTKTGLSTDSDTLNALAGEHELPGLILEYRGLAKLKSTYVDALPRLVDGSKRVHTRLNQTVTATGRLSSKDPNLQNIPIRTEDGAKIRRAFVAGPGKQLLSADYNQIELRVLAHLSGDEALIEAFRGGRDVHSATAAEVFGVDPQGVTADMRRASKVINYGIIYGMGPVRMSRELGISRAEASGYIERYFARYPRVQEFYTRMLDAARETGYVSTILGRRRYLPEILSEHGGQRQMAERVATNTPIQGSAADIIKLAMVRLAERLSHAELTSVMVLQIHDELLLECPESEVRQALTLTRDAMENAVELAVPVVVDVGVGANWAEAH